jgi:hypothetical protein
VDAEREPEGVMDETLEAVIAGMYARESAGAWAIVQHDPVCGQWTVFGPYPSGELAIEQMEKLRGDYAATADLPDEGDRLTNLELHLASVGVVK